MNEKELLDIAARLGRVGFCIRHKAMQVSKLGRQNLFIIIKTQKNDL